MRVVAIVMLAVASVVWSVPGAAVQQCESEPSAQRTGGAARDTVEKWSQLPDISGNLLSSYYNFDQSTLYQCADDFYCTDGTPIVSVEWWGVDMAWLIQYFKIWFYADVPGPPFGQPGACLYSQTCTSFTEEDLPGGWGTRYTTELPVVFEQQAGNTYWISIVAYVSEGHTHAAEWYWFACVSGDCWNSNTVQTSSVLRSSRDWAATEDDLAFALYADAASPVESVSWGRIKAMFH